MERRDGDATGILPTRRVNREFLGIAPSGGRSPGARTPSTSGMSSHREPEAPGLGELPIGTNLGISTARPFLLFVVSPPVKMSQAGSSGLENLLGQWESSQLADKSPQWEQPVLFPMLLVIPRARKYPQIPLASPFLSHESPSPPLESTPQNALLGFSNVFS